MFFAFFAVTILIGPMSLASVFKNENCLDPPDLKQKLAQFRVENELHPSNSTIKSKYPNEILKASTSNSTCPNSVKELYTETQTVDLSSLSTCPTYSAINYNKLRYPRAIPEQLCRCSFINSSGCLTLNGKTGIRYECAPVYIKILVLHKKSCKNHYAEYIPVWEEQQVGCTCQKSPHFK